MGMHALRIFTRFAWDDDEQDENQVSVLQFHDMLELSQFSLVQEQFIYVMKIARRKKWQ